MSNSAKTGKSTQVSTSTKPKPAPDSSAEAAPVAALQTNVAQAGGDGPRPVIAGPIMRKKELIDTVVERSGIKKKDAKPVIDALLGVLGEALADHRELNLLPFGKFKVINEKDLSNGKMLRVKIRQIQPADNNGLNDAGSAKL